MGSLVLLGNIYVTIGIIVVAVMTVFLSFILLLAKQYKRCPSNRVLVIYGKAGHAGAASKTIHGGAAFVSKSEQPSVLMDTIVAVAAGRMVFPYLDIRSIYDNPLSTLTRREMEVLADLASGRTNKQIARDLGVSLNTIKYHVRNLYQKLAVNSRGQAIALYLKS